MEVNEVNITEESNETLMEDGRNSNLISDSSSTKLKHNVEDLEKITNEINDLEENGDMEFVNLTDIKKKIIEYTSEIKRQAEVIKLYEAKELEAADMKEENCSIKKQLEQYQINNDNFQINKQTYVELQQKLVEMQVAEVPNRNELKRKTDLNESLQKQYTQSKDELDHYKEQFLTRERENALLSNQFEHKLKNKELIIESLQEDNDSQTMQLTKMKLQMESFLEREEEFKQYKQICDEKMEKVVSKEQLKQSVLMEQNQSLQFDLNKTQDLNRINYEKMCTDLEDKNMKINLLCEDLKNRDDHIAMQEKKLCKIKVLENELVIKEAQLQELSLSSPQIPITEKTLLDINHKLESLQEAFEATIKKLHIKETELVNQKLQSSNDLKGAYAVSESLKETLEEKDKEISRLIGSFSDQKSDYGELKERLHLVEEHDGTNLQFAETDIVVVKSSTEINSLNDHQQCQEAISESERNLLNKECEIVEEKNETVSQSLAYPRTIVSNQDKLLRENNSFRLNEKRMEDIIKGLTSSLSEQRYIISGLEARLVTDREFGGKNVKFSSSDGSIPFERYNSNQSHGELWRSNNLAENLTSWVDESRNLGFAVSNCLNEATELSKLDNFIIPITYSLETGNEHVTGQISLVFDAFLAVLKKYQGISSFVKNSSIFYQNGNVIENEDSVTKAHLLQLLSTELETSSSLYHNVENLKNLVELNILKIIMQNPAPMLRERQMFGIVCMLTTQLLQYFSLSQKKDCSRMMSTKASKDGESFDFTLVNMMPEKRIHSDLEFSFDDCGQDASINSVMMEPEGIKSSLKSTICPDLVKVLKGNYDSVDVEQLGKETKRFETSLEAAIGLIEAQLLSKNDNSCPIYFSLNEPKMPDEERINSLQEQLQHMEGDNEDLRQKLHQIQGLLSGAREANFIFEEERNSLEEQICKLSREIQSLNTQNEVNVEVHTIHTSEGQDLQRVLRDSKDKVKTLLACKKKENLGASDLISMNDELEVILKNVLSESERSIDQVLGENVDLSSQLQAAERKIYSNKRFIDEQIIERDKDVELLEKENEIMQKALKERETHEEIYSTLNDEVESLQKEIINKDCNLESEIANREEISDRLGHSLKKIEELRRTIENLEGQLADKFRDELALVVEVNKLKDELGELQLRYKQQIENVFESGFEDNFSESNKFSDDEQPTKKSESPNYGRSAMEELGLGRSVLFETTGIRRLEGLLEKLEKAVAANINSSRTSISHCSEEDISAKDTIDVSAALIRSLSPHSWECKLDEILASFEIHSETLLKQNADLIMQLKTAKKECEEIGLDNESNIKRMDTIKDTLARDASITERKWSERLHEADREKAELMKKHVAHLLKISNLQETIEKAKIIPSVDSDKVNRVSALQKLLEKRELTLFDKNGQVDELNVIVRNLKARLTEREEEIKKLVSNSSKPNSVLPLESVSQSLNSNFLDLYSNCSEVQRRDPGTRNTSIISLITKQSEIGSSKDRNETLLASPNHLEASEFAVVEAKFTQNSDEKMDELPVNMSIASEDSFSLNKEFDQLEIENNKLKEVARLVSERNSILISDIELLTGEKIELESKLEKFSCEIQAKETLLNNLKMKNDQDQIKMKVHIDDLLTKIEKISSKFDREKNINSSFVKNLCEKDQQIKRQLNDVCELKERHKKEMMNCEQTMLERMTEQMKDLADNLNNKRQTDIQELEENYKELLSRQEANYRMNISNGSLNDTILNLTLKDLEKLKSNKMLRMVHKEGMAILSLTEGDKLHNSLLDCSDLTTSIDESQDCSKNISNSTEVHLNYKGLYTYMKEKLEELENDKKSLDEEIFAERLTRMELINEQQETLLQLNSLQCTLKDVENNAEFYKNEAENVRLQLELIGDQLLREKLSSRKQRIAFDLEIKKARDNDLMQDEVIKKLKSSLQEEAERRVKLINDLDYQKQIQQTRDNVLIDLSETNVDFGNESINENTEILDELEEAKFKVCQLNAQLNSIQFENNLLHSKIEHRNKKIACLELKTNSVEKSKFQQGIGIKELRNNGVKLDVHKLNKPSSFRGEEISLRKALVALQLEVDCLKKEKAEKSSEIKRMREMCSMERQEIVDLYMKLYAAQSEKEPPLTLPAEHLYKYSNRNNIEVKTVSTNTNLVSYQEELKTYLMYSQQGRQHNRSFLWDLIVSRLQFKSHTKALGFQKKYLMRCLRDCDTHDKYIQRLTSIAKRAIRPGDKLQRGTQTRSPSRSNKQFRVYVYAVICTFRMRIIHKNMAGKNHLEYFQLIKAIKSDEVSSTDDGLSNSARPIFTAHTPPTKDSHV